MPQVRLAKGEWTYDTGDQLGAEGGFGVVYGGMSEAHGPIAVKRLKREAAPHAHRELRIAQELAGRDLRHVIPILDSGQDAESDCQFVVMPRADKSLQDDIDAGVAFSDAEAAHVLLEIAQGLSEVQDIVHRDLKPANVLQHEGRWKVADFGIARFVEATTSTRTLMAYLTRAYAAPEQWLLERATNATDIYALGCIGYALLTGVPPFPGTSDVQFREQHLNKAPPELEGHLPRLRMLLAMMLRKSPHARPTHRRVKDLLRAVVAEAPQPAEPDGLRELAEIGVLEAQREAAVEAQQRSEAAFVATRLRHAEEAVRILESLAQRLVDSVKARVPQADATPYAVRLRDTVLVVEMPSPGEACAPGKFAHSGWDVIVGGTVSIMRDIVQVRSATLVYAKLRPDGEYRWYEVAFSANPLYGRERGAGSPHALTAQDADMAAGPGVTDWVVAYGPDPIDDECAQGFIDRWAGWLAEEWRKSASAW